ncbi:hypothetical protein [Cohnella thermotolerans]|uniref:hypothetical protein n=1 Tax=Cohnella thermotolerans TaxID=329858 RepID=UPI0003FA8217|nr:hypothetical protein [Cohnella thermotolerans]
MKRFRALATGLLGAWIALSGPTAGMAATVEWPVSTKAAWDKAVANADSAQGTKMRGLYADLVSLQQQENGLDAKIKTMHYSNAEALTVTRNNIKQINAAQLSSLQAKAKETRARYQPLLDKYKQLNQQISAARALGSKEVKALLQTQADLLKPAVQAARDEIKKRDEAYKAAKEATAKIAKTIRTTLADIDTFKVKISAEKSSVTAAKTAISPLSKSFAQSIKKGDAKSAAASLSSLLTLYRQLTNHKEKIYGYEQSIAGIIAKAKRQFPSA